MTEPKQQKTFIITKRVLSTSLSNALKQESKAEVVDIHEENEENPKNIMGY